MAKTIIRNHAEPKWTPVIETRLQIMLGSMLANISRIDVEFERTTEVQGANTMYSCKLKLIEARGEKHVFCNDQPNAGIAIEGAIARARRTITRLYRARSSVWRPLSEQ